MKTAVIGIGIIGQVHLDALKKENADIVAVCDVIPARAEEAKKTFGLSSATYTDYKKMLDEIKPDVVHVCTPHYLHKEMICEALLRGINVLSEKPLCTTLRDLDEILAVEKRATAKLGVCFQNRYNDSSRAVKDFLKDKTVTGGYGVVRWKRTNEYYASEAWRGKWATEGGGVMINQAIHTLDLCQWLIGEPSFVCGTVMNAAHQGVIEVEDTATCLFTGSGFSFRFDATTAADSDEPIIVHVDYDGGYAEIIGDTAYINGEKVATEKLARSAFGKACYGSGHQKLIADFYDKLSSGEPFPITGEEGAKALRLVLKTYESKGKPVPVK